MLLGHKHLSTNASVTTFPYLVLNLHLKALLRVKQQMVGFQHFTSDKGKEGGRHEFHTLCSSVLKVFSSNIVPEHTSQLFFMTLFGLIFLLQVLCTVSDACTCDPKFRLTKISTIQERQSITRLQNSSFLNLKDENPE